MTEDIKPLDRDTILAELGAITDSETTSLILISSSDDWIKVRTFGGKEETRDTIKAAARELSP